MGCRCGVPVGSSDMWRIELLHPMLAHFPIALLIVAALLELLGVFLSSNVRSFIRGASLLLLVLGTGMAWAAVWSGEEAEEIVERTLCDASALELHAEWALRVAWIFSVVSAFALLRWKMLGSPVVSGLITTLALAGAAALGYTGHLGATLVYQHGAAVSRSAAECKGMVGSVVDGAVDSAVEQKNAGAAADESAAVSAGHSD